MLMALMVYNAPKWFLALRRAWLAIVGGFPSVDHIIPRVYFLLLLKLLLITLCVCSRQEYWSGLPLPFPYRSIYIVKIFSYMMRMFKMYFLALFQIDNTVFTMLYVISLHLLIL